MNITGDQAEPLSKTRRKRAIDELQALGAQLLTLPDERLEAVELPDELRTAVREAQRMQRPDEARRRQIQYIGRLMRDTDVEPIRQALAALRGRSLTDSARLHRLERLRDDLLADENVVHKLAAAHPALDGQQLRSLRRAALLEREKGRPPRSYRAIFQLLKNVETSASLPPHDDEARQY